MSFESLKALTQTHEKLILKWVDASGNDDHGRGEGSAGGGKPLSADTPTPAGTSVAYHTPTSEGEASAVYEVLEDKGNRVLMRPTKGLDSKLPMRPTFTVLKTDLKKVKG